MKIHAKFLLGNFNKFQNKKDEIKFVNRSIIFLSNSLFIKNKLSIDYKLVCIWKIISVLTNLSQFVVYNDGKI